MKRNKNRKWKREIENRKRKKKKNPPPSAGPILAQAAPRPPFPLSPPMAQAAQLLAPAPHLTDRPHRSVAPPPSPSRHSPTGSPGQPVRTFVPPMPSPARSPPTASRLVASPLTLAPASATTPPLYPSRPLTPRLPEPSRRRLLHPHHHGKLVVARRPLPSFPLPGAYKRDRPSSVSSTPAPTISSTPPRAQSS
jgi:hypothetical protein